MHTFTRMLLLAGLVLLHAGCATPPPMVKQCDTLAARAPKGFVEFYLGISGATPAYEGLIHVFTPETLREMAMDQNRSKPWWIRWGLFDRTPFQANATTETLCFSGTANGGTRLRMACAPGTHTFLLAPNVNQAVGGLDEMRKVTFDIVENKVTPVRVMIEVLSEGMRDNRAEVNILWTVATGNPQDMYTPVSATYRLKDGSQTLWMASTVSTLVVEGKDARQLEGIRQRLDQSRTGLNLGNPADRAEFVKRYHQGSPQEAAPEGVMIRLTTLNGLQWLPAIALAE